MSRPKMVKYNGVTMTKQTLANVLRVSVWFVTARIKEFKTTDLTSEHLEWRGSEKTAPASRPEGEPLRVKRRVKILEVGPEPQGEDRSPGWWERKHLSKAGDNGVTGVERGHFNGTVAGVPYYSE